MMRLADLVANHEDWLVHQVLAYAKKHGYTRYTSTLAEAWRISIAGISQSLLEALKNQSGVPELLPDEDYSRDPIATFGIIEAQRHRRRGVSLGMFLGLMKYYQQSYIDLIVQAGIGIEEERLYLLFIDRFFDRIELGFCTEWYSLTENRMLGELQSANRCMTNEKNKYLTIFESIGDPVFLFDKENRIENLNRAASELFFGISVPGSTYYDKQKARVSCPWIADELAALDASGQMQVIFEKQVLTGKGLLQFQVKIEQMLDVSEKFSGKVVILNDITKRMQAEETLRASHLIIEGIINAIPVRVFWKDRDLVYLGCNAIFAHDAGFADSKDIIGKDDYQMGWRDQAELYRADDRQVIESGRSKLLIEEPQTTPEGNTIVLLTSKIPLRNSEGEIIGVLGTYMDITERKRALEALRESEQRLADIIDFLPDATFAVDREGKVIAWNRAIEEMTGVPKAEMMGTDNYAYAIPFYSEPRPILIDLIFMDRKEIEEKYYFILRKGDQLIAETFIPMLNGRKGVFLWGIASPLYDSSGSVVGAIESIRDISRFKQTEEELKKSNLQLEIATEHAKQMAAKAEQANAAKSEFLANMSHEIRTPMNAVIGMTSILLNEENLTAEHKDFIETIRMSGDALMVIINDILDFSKMQEDKVLLEEQPFVLRRCIEEALDLVSARAAEKGLNLAYAIEKNVPETIIGDPNRLRQILVNLLGNAVKFTESGDVKLSVSDQTIEDRHGIHFAIQDTGIGIPPSQIDRLFQPFSQVDASVTRNYGGTGLGLAISKRLVELMDGRIWAESEAGKGSTFHFTIKAEIAPKEQIAHPAGTQPSLVGRQVLIVDENRTDRHLLGTYTYSWGMAHLIAASGQDALNWIRRGNTFDVAILDMDMLDMDGVALASAIRKQNKTMPLVMLTSVGQRIDSKLFDSSMTKPIKPSQLHKALTAIFSGQQAKESDRALTINKKIHNNSLRILLAEDNVTSQKVAKQMLKRLGYRADVVANGIEALQALERQPYDVVLMDLKMPEMGGLEATRLIRQRWPDNGPKVIAITAYALQGDREKCLDAGMDDYISKPIKIEELAGVLSKYQTS